LLCFEKIPDWGYKDMFNGTGTYMNFNANGALTLKLGISLYYQNKEPSVEKSFDVDEGKLVVQSNQAILKDVASLLDDKETCDIELIVRDLNGGIEKQFHCHSAILAGT